jgi:epoxyqueuosine reductase QueG
MADTAMNCLDWWVKNGNHCSICIRVCPWNKPDNLFHKTVRILAERSILTGLLISMDQAFGYGKQVIEKRPLQDPSVVRV